MSNSNFCVIIPARLNSNRLPKKVLMEIMGIPMVIKVAQQSLQSNANNVFVATDSEEVIDVCIKYGVNHFLTKDTHQSGTERIVEVVQNNNISDDIIINVQADEPLIKPENINLLAQHILAKQTPMATCASLITNQSELLNPNVVKLVVDKFSNVLYFSRALIPASLHNNLANDNILSDTYLKHIGIYAYKKSFLSEYDKLKLCQIEKIESLEQLRVLYNNIKISTLVVKDCEFCGVDTWEDLDKINQYLSKQ